MHALRRYKLTHLIEHQFGNSRGAFLKATGMSKGRLSQLLDPNEPFGEVAARRIEDRLHLEPGYFDAMDSQTVEWAVKFDSLPQHLKDKWLELVAIVAPSSDASPRE
jgi:hypothetical protein